MLKGNLWYILIFLVGIYSCSAPQQSSENFADLVILNGNILTLDDKISFTSALAVKDGLIFRLGSSDSISELIGEQTEVINLNRETVIPGFIEGHGHLKNLGKLKINLDLTESKNFDEIIEAVKAAAAHAKPGEWITGRGWHQEKWDKPLEKNVKGYPLHDRLSEISPDNPVMLDHASGHAILTNQKAMELARVWDIQKDTAGGVVLRDEDGRPTGIFEENAEGFIKIPYENYLKTLSAEQQYQLWKKYVLAAQNEAIKKGVTSFADAGVTFQEIGYFRRLKKENELRLRVYAMIYEPFSEMKKHTGQFPVIDSTDKKFTVRAIKTYMDGALGSRGAWLLEPYTDDPGNTGQTIITPAELAEIAVFAKANNLQLCTHAIGDRANREVLNVYRHTFNGPLPDARWRIEHVQHIDPADIPRFTELGIIPSMQAIHCISDAPFVEKRLGKERAESGAYVWRDLMNAGAVIVNGTDTPVEDVDPILNFYAAVTRKSLSNNEPFYPQQKMTREEALRSLTINNAYGAFEEKIKGSLATGKVGDITILSQDITKTADDDILKTKVLYTIIAGKIEYAAKN